MNEYPEGFIYPDTKRPPWQPAQHRRSTIRRNERQTQADQREKTCILRGKSQQTRLLDKRLGKGIGAKKERKLLSTTHKK